MLYFTSFSTPLQKPQLLSPCFEAFRNPRPNATQRGEPPRLCLSQPGIEKKVSTQKQRSKNIIAIIISNNNNNLNKNTNNINNNNIINNNCNNNNNNNNNVKPDFPHLLKPDPTRPTLLCGKVFVNSK